MGYTVLAMQKHNYPVDNTDGTECLERINITYPTAQEPLFDINVTIQYLDANLGSCPRATLTPLVKASPAGGANDGKVYSHQALVDVTVTSTDLLGEPRIRYHKRALQKP